MKLSIISTAVALASSIYAAPTFPRIQAQIQNLQVQINKISNDIVQSSSNLKTDYNAGLTSFGTLSNKLAGPQSCSIFTPGTPRTSQKALVALQNSQAWLVQLSGALLDPNNSIQDSDFHADVCQAQQYYSSISRFVGS